MTKLDAVNEIVMKCGLMPVPSLETGLASTASNVERIIDQVELRVQSENWHYNRRDAATLTPDASGHILLAQITEGPVLEMDTDGVDSDRNVTVQNDRLYDLDNHTDVFDGDLTVRYVFRPAFSAVPEKVQQLIAAEAAVAFNEAYGQVGRQMKLEASARKARTRAKAFNTRVAGVNVLGSDNARGIRGDRRQYGPLDTNSST